MHIHHIHKCNGDFYIKYMFLFNILWLHLFINMICISLSFGQVVNLRVFNPQM
jgi:hypothetical protein